MVPSKLTPPERPTLELKEFEIPARPPLPPDNLLKRLRWAVLASIVVNAVLWWEACGFVRNHVIAPPAPIEVTLVPPPPKKPVVKKVEHKVVKPKPKPKPKLPAPKPIPKPVPVQHHTPKPPPHHHMLTATGPSVPRGFTERPGGSAPLGRPVEHEGNSEAPPKPKPQPEPEPPQPQPKPEPPQPQPQPEPKPEPPAPKPEPPPPTSPTQDAAPSNQVYPEIPDELKQAGDYKSFVRVKVEVKADGSFDVTLRTSSGNVDIDQRVLDALKRWKWKPALKDGTPVDSTQYFKFEFEVQ